MMTTPQHSVHGGSALDYLAPRTPPISGTAEARALGTKVEASQRCTASEGFKQTSSLDMMGLQTAGWHWDGGRAFVIMTVPFESIRMAVKSSTAKEDQKKAMLLVVDALEDGRKGGTP